MLSHLLLPVEKSRHGSKGRPLFLKGKKGAALKAGWNYTDPTPALSHTLGKGRSGGRAMWICAFFKVRKASSAVGFFHLGKKTCSGRACTLRGAAGEWMAARCHPKCGALGHLHPLTSPMYASGGQSSVTEHIPYMQKVPGSNPGVFITAKWNSYLKYRKVTASLHRQYWAIWTNDLIQRRQLMVFLCRCFLFLESLLLC